MRVDPLQILTKLAAVQNIPTRRVTPPFEGLEEFDYGLRRSLDPQFDWQEFGSCCWTAPLKIPCCWWRVPLSCTLPVPHPR